MKTKISSLKRVALGMCAAVTIATLVGAPVSAATSTQSIAIPAYEYPTLTDLWPAIEAAGPQVPFVIVNPANGPGNVIDPNYTTQIAENTANGQRSIGYVDTNYQTRTVQDVVDDINKWPQLYPGVSGIFLDRVSVVDDTALCYSAYLHNYIKAKYPSWLTVQNFGVYTAPQYEPYGDIFMNGEMGFAAYQFWVAPNDGFQNNPAYSNRFWHIVHTTDLADFPTALSQTQNNNAGWVYITDDVMPNPYDIAPTYFNTELSDVALLPPSEIPNRGSTQLPAGCVDMDVDASSTQQAGSTTSTHTLTNASSTYTAAGPNKVTFAMPAGITLASATGSGWTCIGNECTYGDIAPSSSSGVLSASFSVSCDYSSGDITATSSVFSAITTASSFAVQPPDNCPAGAGELAHTGSNMLLYSLVAAALIIGGVVGLSRSHHFRSMLR